MKSLLITFNLIATLVCSSVAIAETETDETALPLLHQSMLLVKEGKNEEARSSLEKCLTYKLSPKHESIVRACLGDLYRESDRDKSFDFLKRARELDPTNTGLLPSLGSAYAQRREWTASKECLNGYLAANPEGANVSAVKSILEQIAKVEKEDNLLDQINKAVRLYNDHKYSEAMAILEETQKTQHEHWLKEQEILGMCYLKQGNYKQAADCFSRSLEKDPKQPTMVSALASAYEGMGDLKQARACLKRYLHMEGSGEMAVAAKDRIPVLKKVMKTAGDNEASDYFQAVSKPIITRWSQTRMPLRVYVEPGDAVKNYQKAFDNCIPRALDLWCKASGGKISWTAATDRDNADIAVIFTADPAAVGKSESHMEAGICETNTVGQRGAKIAGINHAAIKLLTTNPDGSGINEEELEATAVHEVGHSLGMKQHSANPEDVMFFAATRSTKNGLTERDSNTIKYLYTAAVYEDGRIDVPGREKR